MSDDGVEGFCHHSLIILYDITPGGRVPLCCIVLDFEPLRGHEISLPVSPLLFPKMIRGSISVARLAVGCY
jgi:hypothetical protein